MKEGVPPTGLEVPESLESAPEETEELKKTTSRGFTPDREKTRDES